jgi:hypothetical protein
MHAVRAFEPECAVGAIRRRGAGLEIRGDRAEIDEIVHGTSGNLISAPATVKTLLGWSTLRSRIYVEGKKIVA